MQWLASLQSGHRINIPILEGYCITGSPIDTRASREVRPRLSFRSVVKELCSLSFTSLTKQTQPLDETQSKHFVLTPRKKAEVIIRLWHNGQVRQLGSASSAMWYKVQLSILAINILPGKRSKYLVREKKKKKMIMGLEKRIWSYLHSPLGKLQCVCVCVIF